MRKLIVSAWVTLDGIFDANTMENWFDPYHSDDWAAYIQEGILASDAFLLGRKTYELLAPYWSAQKNNEMGIAGRLNSAPKYVVSSTLQEATWNNSTLIKDNVVGAITRLKHQSGQGILVFGSATLAQSLMEADLIDELRFLVHPVIIGSGKHFINDGMDLTRLELVKSETFSLGVVLLCYQPMHQ